MADDDELLSVAGRLFGARTEQDVYEIAVSSLVRLTGADECAVAVHENGALMGQEGVTSGLIDAPEGPLADEFGLIERAYRERETVIVADLMDCPRGWQFRESDPGSPPATGGRVPYRSLLCVPLEPQGMLVATANAPRAFDRQTRQTAEGIGSLVDDAVEKLPDPSESTATSDPDRLETAASTLNHEMMSKLMVANSRLEAARENPEPERFDHVADVHDRIETFVKEMARYLRTGGRVPEPERIDVGAVAERTWRVVETLGVELQRPDHLEIVADERMVSDLFENLFRNAAEHGFGTDRSNPDSRQVVRVERLKAGRGFYVEDNGRGVDLGGGESVFESGVTTAADGSGHGLSICRDIATAHGWEISVTEGDRGGARFEITGVEFAGGNRERSAEGGMASELRP